MTNKQTKTRIQTKDYMVAYQWYYSDNSETQIFFKISLGIFIMSAIANSGIFCLAYARECSLYYAILWFILYLPISPTLSLVLWLSHLGFLENLCDCIGLEPYKGIICSMLQHITNISQYRNILKRFCFLRFCVIQNTTSTKKMIKKKKKVKENKKKLTKIHYICG